MTEVTPARPDHAPGALRPASRRMGPWRGAAAVVATVAALVGVAGGVQASSLITGKMIKDETVTSRDLHNGTLTGRDVRDGSLRPADYDGDVVGPDGAQGLPGPQGAAGYQGVVLSPVESVVLADGQVGQLTATCPENHVAVSGSVRNSTVYLDIFNSSPPGAGGRSWTVRFQNRNGSDTTVSVSAICVRVPS